MNTTKLKRFATEARNKLRQGVTNRLGMLGFDEAGIPMVAPRLVPGGAVWKDDKRCTVAFYNGFKALEEQIQRYGVNHVIEEAAYTWFNRLMAIRILTMNELCEPVLRYVGSTRTPLIVDEARQGHIPEMSEEDRVALMVLLDDDTKTPDQFAMLITAFCHNTPLIAKCFGLPSDYTDVLFPVNVLSENGFIDMLNTTDFISDEDYRSSELLGWLYQFYISEKKDQVFAKKGKYDADDIPAATQIFTPNWIVKYMVQNAIGGVLGGKDMLPENQRKYYVDIPEPPTAICHDIEELKVADLACGSGHILNECFDVLYDLYISEGYTRREAIECIFTKNLTGIDIDTRAKQLATFALMLKACLKDESFSDAHCLPRIFNFPEVERYDWRDTGGHYACAYQIEFPEDYSYQELDDAFNLLKDTNILGSIAKFKISIGTRRFINKCVEAFGTNPLYINEFLPLVNGFKIILALTEHYDAIVMNPPYMPTNKIDSLSKYVNEHYKEGKVDIFAVFMMVCMDRLKDGGRMGMINMQSWMFLSSFESLRKLFLKEYTLSSMLHLGARTFDELSGEVVQNAAFVFEKVQTSSPGVYYRLIDGKNCSAKKDMFLAEDNRYVVTDQKQFEKIPGAPIAYWISKGLLKCFLSEKKLCDIGDFKKGMSTGDNSRFIKNWYEVSYSNTIFNCNGTEQSIESPMKWYPINSGGTFRKWHGNELYVVNWADNGAEMKENAIVLNHGGHWSRYIVNVDKFFKPGLSWNAISSGSICVRKFGYGFLFSSASMCGYSDYDTYLIGLLNSRVAKEILSLLAPTMNYGPMQIKDMPLLLDNRQLIDELIEKCISISKEDWDAHETSWDFEENPLLTVDVQTYMDNIDAKIEKHRQDTGETLCIDLEAPQLDSLKWRYEQYCQKWESLFLKLHANEEELNRRFIEIYGLQDELNPHVEYEDITILQHGEISLCRPIRGIEVLGNDLNDKNLEELTKNNWTIDKEEGYVIFPQSRILWNADIVLKQFISYAVGCMMGRYRLDRPGLAIAHPNETPEEIAEYEIPGTNEKFWIDDDGIIPLMPEACGFHDNAVSRMATFVRQTLGDQTQVENLNFIEECLGKSLEQYFIKDFWKDHKKMYQNRPIYWLFASKKGAFQVLVYVHRMNVATVERIRSRYLLPYIERLKKRIDDLQSNESTLSTKQRNQLKALRAQVVECEEYHNRLAVVAERGIVPNLDDGIIKNYALYGDIVAKLK